MELRKISMKFNARILFAIAIFFISEYNINDINEIFNVIDKAEMRIKIIHPKLYDFPSSQGIISLSEREHEGRLINSIMSNNFRKIIFYFYESDSIRLWRKVWNYDDKVHGRNIENNFRFRKRLLSHSS